RLGRSLAFAGREANIEPSKGYAQRPREQRGDHRRRVRRDGIVVVVALSGILTVAFVRSASVVPGRSASQQAGRVVLGKAVKPRADVVDRRMNSRHLRCALFLY